MVKVYLTNGKMIEIDADGADAVYYSDTQVLKVVDKMGTVRLFNWSSVDLVEGIDSYE